MISQMKVTLDSKTIQSINIFQNLTGSSVIDCLEDEELYFIIAKGEYGLAVGKNGAKIRNAERLFKKTIKIFEYSSELEEFIKNMIPESQEIEIGNNNVVVRIRPNDKARVIGKGGKKVKVAGRFLERLFEINNLRVK